jgi:methionyl-tRNA formyltransferase
MKLVFMGTPDFAVTALNRLLESRHEVVAVVTVADKQQGRGRKFLPSPVKQVAVSHHLPVLQPDRLSDPDFVENLKTFQADAFVVVAFKILPKVVFEIPPKGTINLHASLLPAYRGAAPINWVLINGEKATGVSTILIDEKVDTGDLLLQRSTEIGPEMNAGELHDKLAHLGSTLLVETLDQIEKGALQPSRQDESRVSRAPKLTRELAKIDFHLPASEVHNKIRGLSPHPGGYCFHRDKMVKLLKSLPGAESDKPASPGTVVRKTRQSFGIQCAPGVIEIFTIQPEGKKAMSAGAYINGAHLEIGEVFI